MSSTVRMPAPDVWGVGRVLIGGQTVPWPVSQRDVDDESRAHVVSMRRLGVGEGDVVVICSLLSETIHVVPLEQAANLVGARYSSTDATEFDAFRTAAMIRQVSPTAVIGVNRDVVTGLRNLGHDLREVFEPVGAVATTDDDAHRALEHAGLAPRRWLKLGPTSGFECGERDGVHFDAARLRVGVGGDGGLTVTTTANRLTACADLPIGLRGELVSDPCPCGSDDPRVRLTQSSG
jgi:hypothetical protein